ncbi:SSI family serine proteinase inhibitor [Streptomyces sp. XD-27]|uniref:SSI family serine proteinase inhibitor n=1 Tax=Streptomyces sp. XD-27 TaxID=3062779 RepID=UPI0026F467B2|nr:SSI family serine proteinase inhibitor [Streptomyces sp. XD-27]WKX71666.1 SSI family serine proteinase inhibitor [Streptomyces sp. XD-27]
MRQPLGMPAIPASLRRLATGSAVASVGSLTTTVAVAAATLLTATAPATAGPAATTASAAAPAPAATPVPVPLPERYGERYGEQYALRYDELADLPSARLRPHSVSTPHRLVLTYSHTGEDADRRKYRLHCHPTGGTHPDARAACARLDEIAQWNKDPFAPIPQERVCTMQYGGPATARITGTWAGRRVNAKFTRVDGCEVTRWNRLAPLLPPAGE